MSTEKTRGCERRPRGKGGVFIGRPWSERARGGGERVGTMRHTWTDGRADMRDDEDTPASRINYEVLSCGPRFSGRLRLVDRLQSWTKG
jgi:hypothetical protein